MDDCMHTLIFGIAWTFLAAVGVAALHFQVDFSQQSPVFKIIMTAMPFAGILLIRDGLRRVRRYRSVRREDSLSGPIYVWAEFDGSTKRDTQDPRPAWDADDRNFADP